MDLQDLWCVVFTDEENACEPKIYHVRATEHDEAVGIAAKAMGWDTLNELDEHMDQEEMEGRLGYNAFPVENPLEKE